MPAKIFIEGLKTVSEANSREHWVVRRKRHFMQQQAATMHLMEQRLKIEKLRAPILKHMKKCWTRRPADRCAVLR